MPAVQVEEVGLVVWCTGVPIGAPVFFDPLSVVKTGRRHDSVDPG